MVLLTSGSLEDLVPGPGEAAGLVDQTLPGLALKSLKITDTHELFWGKAEVYLFGVALDSSGKVKIIPFGVGEIGENTDAVVAGKMKKNETKHYLGQGMPLVAPPVSDFLFLRLLVIEDDHKIRDVAPLLKAAGELVSSKEAIALLVAGGMPQAAAVAAVVGKATEGIAAALEKNRDDLIGIFQGYFTLADTAADISAADGDARAEFHWVQ